MKEAQIAAEGANKYQKQQQAVVDVFSATPSENQSVDDFITSTKKQTATYNRRAKYRNT